MFLNVSGFASQRVHPVALRCTSPPCPLRPALHPSSFPKPQHPHGVQGGLRDRRRNGNVTVHLPRPVQLHTAISQQASRWLRYAEPAQKSPFWRRTLAEITYFLLLLLFGRRFDAPEEQLKDTPVELDVGGRKRKEAWGGQELLRGGGKVREKWHRFRLC